jgi:hypothetical protein
MPGGCLNMQINPISLVDASKPPHKLSIAAECALLEQIIINAYLGCLPCVYRALYVTLQKQRPLIPKGSYKL